MSEASLANLRPFQPGQSGNPGGRPKGLAAKVRETVSEDQLADFYAAVAFGHEGKLRELGIAPGDVKLSDRMDAAGWLADRAWGRPTQAVSIEAELSDRAGLGQLRSWLELMTDEERAVLSAFVDRVTGEEDVEGEARRALGAG